MKINSHDLPQADRIESVLKTVIAVGNGAKTDIEIANRVSGIEGDDRQGRYYRSAAEIMGLIINNRNNSTITDLGKIILRDPQITNPQFIKAVLGLKIYQSLFPYFELHPDGLTKNQIQDYLTSIADDHMGPTMIPRRISTIIAWPKALGLINENNGKFFLTNMIVDELESFEIKDMTQPILPTTGDLNEFQEISSRMNGAQEVVKYYKDKALLDRANNAHSALVNLVARRIRNTGKIPKSNQLIDLAVKMSCDYIFEMKSTNNKNAKHQVRRGLSQLYEYRYLHNLPEAKLVLVVEKPLEGSNIWFIDYLENDRNVLFLWDGDGQLHGTDKAKSELSFLNIT